MCRVSPKNGFSGIIGNRNHESKKWIEHKWNMNSFSFSQIWSAPNSLLLLEAPKLETPVLGRQSTRPITKFKPKSMLTMFVKNLYSMIRRICYHDGIVRTNRNTSWPSEKSRLGASGAKGHQQTLFLKKNWFIYIYF